MKTNNMSTALTYETDCFRRIKDEETGELRVARMAEKRAVSATLVTHEGSVFHNGARIA